MPPTALVSVAQGRLAGAASADGKLFSFKGVPYARAPVGRLRWRMPEPPAHWPGARPALDFGARCPQPSRAPDSIGYFATEKESEDCLFLNVWTGSLDREARRPVMVWFHGGAYYLGSGAVPLFDGEQLARRGAVVVTVNFRLGRLGFLAHPALSEASPQRASGNYGVRDQIAALEWLRENLPAFGGDPDCVTVFGQSAGAASVSLLMASPLARGLFHRAIAQSGGLFGHVGATSGTGDSMQSLEHAERSGLALGNALGARTLDELRGLSPSTLQCFRPGAQGAVFDPSLAPPGAWDTAWPIVEGAVLPEGPRAVFRRGAQHDVPLITGANANEGVTMPAAPSLRAMQDNVRREFGPLADAFLEAYRCSDEPQARRASREMVGDRNFVWQNWTFARLHAAARRSAAFHYAFHRQAPIAPDASYLEGAPHDFGAFHGAEIPYVFSNLHVRAWPWQAADRALSETLSAYWLNFARSGDPNGAGLPHWPAFDPAAPRSLRFDEHCEAVAVPPSARMALWDRCFEL